MSQIYTKDILDLKTLSQRIDSKSDIGHTHDDLLSNADRVKLDGIEEGANKIILNDTLNSTSITEAATANVVRQLNDKVDKIIYDESRIDKLENELRKSENISYSTINGVKEFNCKDGYVDNVYIEGETLINVTLSGSCSWNPAMLRLNNINDQPLIEVNQEYTAFNLSNKEISLHPRILPYDWQDEIKIAPHSSIIFTIGENQDLGAILGHETKGWRENDIDYFNKSVVILKGNHINREISYFEGMKSVGQWDRIELLSLSDNLFNKEDFVVGSTNSIVGDEFLIDSKTNRITHVNPIPVEMFEYLDLSYSANVKTHLYELDENGVILALYAWSRYSLIRPITPNTKYIRVIFSYDDNRDMTLSDYDKIRPFLTRKYDRSQIPVTLRSLNDTKDKIIKREDKYYKLQKLIEFTINGGSIVTQAYYPTNGKTYRLCFDISILGIGGSEYTPFCSDKVVYNIDYESPIPFQGFISDGGKYLWLFFDKNIVNGENYKQYLNDNPITFVSEVRGYQIFELSNFNTRVFSDKTTFLINSGVVQTDVSFEVTNSLGSSLNVAAEQLNNSMDNIKTLNSLKTLNDDGFAFVANDCNDFYDKNITVYVHGKQCANAPHIDFNGYVTNITHGWGWATQKADDCFNNSKNQYARELINGVWQPWRSL